MVGKVSYKRNFSMRYCTGDNYHKSETVLKSSERIDIFINELQNHRVHECHRASENHVQQETAGV